MEYLAIHTCVCFSTDCSPLVQLCISVMKAHCLTYCSYKYYLVRQTLILLLQDFLGFPCTLFKSICQFGTKTSLWDFCWTYIEFGIISGGFLKMLILGLSTQERCILCTSVKFQSSLYRCCVFLFEFIHIYICIYIYIYVYI